MLMQGVLCGDCLFMRYGENILEVAKKDEWTCPVCRGLCNCSNHRIRGWAPTGALYRRAIAEGTHVFAPMLAAAVINRKRTGWCAQLPTKGCLQETIWHPQLVGCLIGHLSLSVVV